MRGPFIGTEAIAAGQLTPYQLRSRHRMLYPGVYAPKTDEVTAVVRAQAAWLWSRRRGVVAGRSAAALHGAKWVDAAMPAELIGDNRHRPAGVATGADAIADDEVVVIGGIPATSPTRTVLDIGCRRPFDQAVTEMDAVLRATRVPVRDVAALIERYAGRRGIRAARHSLKAADGGAESPRETWLRLLLIRAGFPRPQTQIRVPDDFGGVVWRVDMGWAELKIAVEYDGGHHWASRRVLIADMRRAERLRELGWIVIRVTVEDTEASIIGWVAAARARRL